MAQKKILKANMLLRKLFVPLGEQLREQWEEEQADEAEEELERAERARQSGLPVERLPRE